MIECRMRKVEGKLLRKNESSDKVDGRIYGTFKAKILDTVDGEILGEMEGVDDINVKEFGVVEVKVLGKVEGNLLGELDGELDRSPPPSPLISSPT